MLYSYNHIIGAHRRLSLLIFNAILLKYIHIKSFIFEKYKRI